MTVLQSVIVGIIGMLVVMVELAVLAVVITLISKIIRALSRRSSRKPAGAQRPPAPAPAAPAQPAATVQSAGQSAGAVNLYNVDEKTAAIVMAVVSHESGIPLEQLRFISIKALDDTQEAQRP